MKKFLVSFIVIIAFVGYSMYQRISGSQAMPVISPKGSFSQTSVPTSTPTPTSLPSISTDTPTPTTAPSSLYKDGTYVGDAVDAFYGMIQVSATIQNGKLTNVQFLQYPQDRGTSIYINQQADPLLAQEAIQAQSANVDIVSGATDSSNAFIQSLTSALNKAKS